MPIDTEGSFQQVQQALIAQGESNQPILIIAKPGDHGPMRAAKAWGGARSGAEIELMRQRLIELGYDATRLREQYGEGSSGLFAFRAPHFSINRAALVGRTVNSPDRVERLGEYQLAFSGVLFLDDVPEFSETHIDVLAARLHNQPLGVRVVGVVYTKDDRPIHSEDRGKDHVGTQSMAWYFADRLEPKVIDTTGYAWVPVVLKRWMKSDTPAPRKLLYLFDD